MSVAVVVPLFDKAPFVERCLRSVLRQSISDFTLIVVDDGSTDDGPGVVSRLADPRLTLLRQPRAGPGAARNRGWRESGRPLVAFLDADDEWRPEFLEKTLTLARRREELVAVFTNVATPGRGARLRRVAASDGVVDDYFETALQNGFGMCSSSVLVRRAALEACGGFAEVRGGGEDLDTWARLAWSGPVGHVPECLAIYHESAPTRELRDATACPALLASFAAWSRAGRIRAPLLPSSRRFANRALADHCVELAHAGRGREARALARTRWHGGPPRGALLKALAWSWLPAPLLSAARRARGGRPR